MTLVAFGVGNWLGNLELARAFAFTTIILVQHFILLDVWVRNSSVFRSKIFNNKTFLLAFFGPLILQPLILYVPYLQSIFKIEGMSGVQLFLVIALSGTLLISSEIRKTIVFRKR
jgi:Ca2+-transporting ATPase